MMHIILAAVLIVIAAYYPIKLITKRFNNLFPHIEINDHYTTFTAQLNLYEEI